MTEAVPASMAGIQPAQPNAAVQAGILEWQRIVARLDWDRLPDLLARAIVYRNPATLDSYHGKATMVAIMRTVFAVMQDFTYHRRFAGGTGYVLEFSARLGDAGVFGVDLIEFDAHGKITDFMVMMRPAGAVLALAAEAGKRMAATSN